MIYGYCRVSTQSQNIERQVRNILAVFPDAEIIREVYTGTTFQGRDKLEKLLKKVRRDDTIVFDSVSRMSRSAEEGFTFDIVSVEENRPYPKNRVYLPAQT